ncbi:MAG: FlgO family outer membrane protein [Magnetococcus sp. YQC-9]
MNPSFTSLAPRLGAVVLIAFLASGCGTNPVLENYPLVSTPLTSTPEVEPGEIAQQAAEVMLQTVGERLHPREVILPASFVEENNMDKSSPLGRMLAKQMATRFTQAGHSVVELTLRSDILLKKGAGQFVLSQEAKEIKKTHKVSAVLAGSYVTAKNRVYVNAQLVRTSDGVVMASSDYSMPLTPNIKALLK